VAIMTGGPDDTNLNDRIQGVLTELGIGRLDSLWTLHRRSPIPCRDSYETALGQLEMMLEDPSVDAIISVGWWAQMAPDYNEIMARFRKPASGNQKFIIFVGGHPTQLAQFSKGLSDVNVDLDFQAMGRAVYTTLQRLANGDTIPQMTTTPMKVYRQDEGESNDTP